MGEVYLSLGQDNKAENLLNKIENIELNTIIVDRNLLMADIFFNKFTKSDDLKAIELLNNAESLVNNNEKLIEITYKKIKTYHHLREFEKKLILAEKMLTLGKQTYQPESIKYALVLQNYASSTGRAKNIETTLKIFLEAEEILIKNLGSDHHLVANCKHSIGSFFESSHSELALKYINEAYQIYLKIYGDVFPRRVDIEVLLGRINSYLKNHDDAIKHLKLAIEYEKKYFSNNAVKIAFIEYSIANTYLINNQDIPLAIKYFESSISTYKAKGIYYQSITIMYAKALGLVERNDIAKQYLRQNIIIYEKDKKENNTGHLSLSLSKIYLAEILMKEDKHCKIKTLLTEALPDFKFQMGEDHDTYRNAQKDLRETELIIQKNHLNCQ